MMTGGENLTFDKIDPQDYEDWYHTKEGLFFDRKEKELIAKILEPKPNQSLLEIGCGTGHFLRWFKIFGLRLSGVDSSKRMIEFASRFLDRDIGLKVASAQNLPFKDDSFDIVVFITTLEFLDNPKQALEEALRVSKNKVFIGFLNKLSLLAINRRIKGLFKDSVYNYAKFYSIFQIRRMIKDINEGLRIKSGGIYAKWANLFSPFIGVLIEK